MKIKIVEKKTNKLLDRQEVKFEIEAEQETPKRFDVKSKLAALLNHDENLLIITGIHQQTGSKLSHGTAHAYSSLENMQKVEPPYLIKRNVPKEKEQSS